MKTRIAIVIAALFLVGCDRPIQYNVTTRLKCGEMCVGKGGAFTGALFSGGKVAYCRCDIPVNKSNQ